MSAKLEGNVVHLNLSDNTHAKISLYGATVISWVSHSKEHLFLSEHAILDGTKAIRGGIPLVFPIFGTKEGIKLPQHGFARNSQWDYLGTSDQNDSEVTVKFGLKDSQIAPAMHSAWSHSFNIIYTVTLTSSSLKTMLEINNKGEDKFDFNVLLHTYLRVPDVEKVDVTGLKSCTYVDKVAGTTEVETRDAVSVSSEVDRIYCDVPSTVTVNCGDGKIAISLHGLPDAVVWNPWIDKSKSMADFGDEEFHHMICVESGAVAKWSTLQGGEAWTCGQELKYENS